MEMLLPLLVKLTKLPEKDLVPILYLFEPIQVPAKAPLLTSGSICSKVWFVGSGSLRAYYYQDERKRNGDKTQKNTREVTDWLIAAGGLYTPMQSFSQQVPSSYYIETLQSSQLFTLSHQNYLALKRSQPEMVFKIYEHVMSMDRLRLHICNLRYPEDRLRVFELTHRGLIGQLPVYIQASYLNIEPKYPKQNTGKALMTSLFF